MDYIRNEENGQVVFEQSVNDLRIPCCLYGFTNTGTTKEETACGRGMFCFYGKTELGENDRICPECGRRMHINDRKEITLRHLPFGGTRCCVRFPHIQLRCPKCKATKMQYIAFQAEDHRITTELWQYIRDLLAMATYTNKQVSEITGVGENIIKEIDLARLKEKYTIDSKQLIKPEKTTRILGIDEFKLHNGHQYATHIIDMENGHILWLAKGKRKNVVYDFIDHVGLAWMAHVEAVACDMNSDFQEAFEERCPHIQPVFDHFHLIKNFNDKVVSAIRKDEQKRLLEAGDKEGAKALKKTKYILTAKRSTLQQKDQRAGEVLREGSTLFRTESVIRKAGYEEKYNQLLADNKLFFTLDILKEKLSLAYSAENESQMAAIITDIMDICTASGNQHLLWFKRLLDSHLKGVIAYASFRISSGKIEGINQRIKTLRRSGYGYPDDAYFFLKLFDMSRSKPD